MLGLGHVQHIAESLFSKVMTVPIVGLAGRSCGQSCEQSEAPKISSLQSGRNIDLADGSPVTATAAAGLVSSGAMERQLCDAPAGQSPAAADFETVDN